jgi:hypothetical protein
MVGMKRDFLRIRKIPIAGLVTITSLLSFVIIFIVQLHLSSSANYVMGQISAKPNITLSSLSDNDVVSTRGHFDFRTTGELNPEHNLTDYVYYGDATENSSKSEGNEIRCPPEKEIAIYVHGEWTDETSAYEQFNRTAISLAINNYSIPLVGFSWDSNTPFSVSGWKTAEIIAEKNGPKLAQFILNFKNKCSDTDIRLIAHSLGAAIVNSSLVSLNNNQDWNKDNESNIASVHLLGAAISRGAAASNTTFGNAIEKEVGNFYNLRDPEDNMLEYIYRYIENHDALGLLGIQHSLPLPRNYFEQPVDSEIPPLQDADGNSELDCFDFFVILPGDNHCGYMGFRGLPPFEDIPRNDGAIDVIVQDWLDES